MPGSTIKGLVESANGAGTCIGAWALRFEAQEQGVEPQVLMERMAGHFTVMQEAVERGLTEPIESRSGLVGGQAKILLNYSKQGNSLSDPNVVKTAALAIAAMEVNACMGRIVASPTAGSSGILPAVLIDVSERLQSSTEQICLALFCAGAIGRVIANNASISGAEGGCQAEVGSAAAMAAGAAVELAGGTPEQVAQAVALMLKNVLGLACDPVAGLVEIPCVKRNGMYAPMALLAADMALAGIKSAIPVDEVIQALAEVGDALPATLRETAQGGLANTPTGMRLMLKLQDAGAIGQ
jgi:L-serine dehydratase